MVGVAGKSKACNDCKRRRVKCGAERPGCARCARARIQCSGYQHQVFFINKTLADPSVSAPIVLAKRSVARLECSENASIQDELDALVELAKASTESPSRFRLGAFKLLQKTYLPQPEVADENPTHASPYPLARAVCELQHPCPVLDHALIAFCTIQVYVTRTGSASRDQGAERYNTTLGYLSTALSRKADTAYVYMLASIWILSTCELFLFPTDNGLRVHVQGIADILSQKKDFTNVSTPIWLRLCSRLRTISTLSQLTYRQKGSVSAAQWADLMPNYSNLDPLDQLLDIICELPQVLDLAAQLCPAEESGDSDVEAVVTALWSVMRGIYGWQARLGATTSTPFFTTVPAKLNNPSDDSYDVKLFPFALEFRSILTAAHFLLSWGIQLHIQTILLRFIEERSEAAIVPSEFLDLYDTFGSIQTEAKKLARYLCQSFEYCHKIEMGTFGPQTTVYVRWILKQFFAQCGAERELEWCQNVKNMSGMGTRCGIQLMMFESSIKGFKRAVG